MNIQKLRKYFEQALSEIEKNKSGKRYRNIRTERELQKNIEVEMNALEKLVQIIIDFNNHEFSKEEKLYVEYIDKKETLSYSRVKGLQDFNYKLEKYKNKEYTNQVRVYLKEGNIESATHIIFNYEIVNHLDRIKDFINGKLSEDLAWHDGVIIKLNTENHLNSITNLNIEINQLHRILRAFGRLNKDNESDFEINQLETGSLILTILTISGVVITLGKAANQVLDAIKKVYEIKKHAVELKQIKSENLKDVITNLEKAASIDSKASEIIASQLIEESNYNNDDINEVRAYLIKAIEYLFKFYDEGGEIKLLLNPIADKDKRNNNVRKTLSSNNEQLSLVREELKKLLSKKDLKILNMKFDDDDLKK